MRSAVGAALLVCSDRQQGEFWVYALRQLGLAVTLVSSTSGALSQWEREAFSLVLIDVCGPELDGVELARRLRSKAANPILLFTTYSDEARTLTAYQAGVDECVVKPVSPSLFQAKVRAWLRRSWTVPAAALERVAMGPLQLDPATRSVMVEGGSPIRLTNLEFNLLYLLLSHPGQTLPADLILDRVWGYSGGDTKVLKNAIYRLRRKIEPEPGRPRYIKATGAGGYLYSP